MYCIRCGVKLADSEKCCPLCGTVPFHPDIQRQDGAPLYPMDRYPHQGVNRTAVLGVVSILLLIPVLVTLICDLSLHGRVTWSGYVVGAISAGYIAVVLPMWFRRPNPIIFVPCAFTALGLYVLYIDLTLKGGWFLGFAFPIIGFLGGLVTVVVALMRCLRRGILYIFGGALIALGAFMPVLELLIKKTFDLLRFTGWSLYPMAALAVLGGALIFLAICTPARESVERRFFV